MYLTTAAQTSPTPYCSRLGTLLPACHNVSGAQIHHILRDGHESWFSAADVDPWLANRSEDVEGLKPSSQDVSQLSTSSISEDFPTTTTMPPIPFNYILELQRLESLCKVADDAAFPWALGISRSREVMSDSRRRICRPDRQSRRLDTSRGHRMRLS